VRAEAPHTTYVELDCGHVPQLERPGETHEVMRGFLATGR
jgi:pimeloyl-ACP methyl ester carboxylesterase